ncbi:MAG TPA: glycosyltransferase [Anaerolineales bacterium]|nr:glycosyltransferase [Anaerolineales bacterium]
MPERRRVIFLFSDTGGGHRSSAEAVAEAIARQGDSSVEVVLVDALRSYAPTPFNRLPGLYPRMVRTPRMWGLGFRVSNGRQRGRVLTSLTWPYVRGAAQRLVAEVSGDLFVSFHPLLIAPTIKALGRERPPFYAVVTDLATGHTLWYHHRLDLCFLPTEEAERRALDYGMKSEQLRLVGLPVAERFCLPIGDRKQLRGELGWPQDRPIVLVVGGGEGMGPLFETARAIARGGVGAGLAIVTGRNETLRQRLQAVDWEIPTWVYGFEHRMPQMMQAATLLVTKAGPSTIAEAANAGLPLVLYSYLPGQEEGNVEYVVRGGLGRWAPGAIQTSAAVRELLANPAELERMALACQCAARPQAAQHIAEAILQRLKAGVSDSPLPA